MVVLLIACSQSDALTFSLTCSASDANASSVRASKSVFSCGFAIPVVLHSLQELQPATEKKQKRHDQHSDPNSPKPINFQTKAEKTSVRSTHFLDIIQCCNYLGRR